MSDNEMPSLVQKVQRKAKKEWKVKNTTLLKVTLHMATPILQGYPRETNTSPAPATFDGLIAMFEEN